MCRLALEGGWDGARAAHLGLLPLHGVMFLEASPGPVKAALAHLGKIKPALRLPMVPPSPSSLEKIAATVARVLG